jgi:hypothetical protein
MYCSTAEYIRPRGHPFRSIDPVLLSHPQKTLCALYPENSLVTALINSPGRRVLRTSKRPEPVNLVHCPSCDRHEPFCYSRRHRPTPKNTLRGNPGCAVGPKTPTKIGMKTGRVYPSETNMDSVNTHFYTDSDIFILETDIVNTRTVQIRIWIRIGYEARTTRITTAIQSIPVGYINSRRPACGATGIN